MVFFDKQQEVMDIQLTQYGKYLYSIGSFKPEFYQFFDDDILYNSQCAGFTEHQNDVKDRILKNTPKLKTQYLTNPVEERFDLESRKIESKERDVFEPIIKEVAEKIQEKILLYPLNNKDIGIQQAPRFDLRNFGKEFEKITFSEITGSGVPRKRPTIHIRPEFNLKEERGDTESPSMYSAEKFVDLASDEIIFRDNSKIKLLREKIVLDLQQLNADSAFKNFKIEVFEVEKTDSGDDVLRKIKKLKEINKLFKIKTDKDVTMREETEKQNGHYKRGEDV